MKLELVNEVRVFNRATRRNDVQRFSAGSAPLSAEVERAVKDFCTQYRMSAAQVVVLALTYYFGDGADHLSCEHCGMYADACTVPAHGEQTTMPLLD